MWNPRSRALDAALASSVTTTLAAGDPLAMPPGTPPLWDGQRPTNQAEWIELGRRVFFEFPLRAEVFMEFALPRPELQAAVGVEHTPAGDYPGLVLFDDVDGRTRVGITCAVCHTTVEDGQLVIGAARRKFDYGKLRIAYHNETHEPVEAELMRRMATWGPGRADVTEDLDEDPVAIPDLWGLRDESVLTQAGTIRHIGPAALAIRQETQLLHANHQRIHPPRELAWALAMYLYSLAPPPRESPVTPEVTRGRALFDDTCRKCHDNAAYGGEPVPAARVGTDRALADGGARGTGTYRPAPLLRIFAAAPYFHHGAVPTLEDVLSPERLQPGYTRSPLRPGPVPGHEYGTDLSADDRAALVAFLRTL